MTAPSTPREQRQRVSDEELRAICDGIDGHDRPRRWVALDLRDARATIAQRDAEIVHLRATLETERDEHETDIVTLVSENNEALATARRDGWIAGREAAAATAVSWAKTWSADAGGNRWNRRADMAEGGARVAEHIRALAPPAATDGGSDG